MTSGLDKLEIQRKTGGEEFHSDGTPIGLNLIEFWRWSASDLVSNATRGVLAEFIVAASLEIDIRDIRDEWDAFDLETDEGIKVEVKSAAYIQSWYQKELSIISFRTPKTLSWDPNTNTRNSMPSRDADVYVFALLAHKDKKSIDPMNVSQWVFYVVPTTELNQRTRSQSSITLKTLEKLSGGPKEFSGLKQAVVEAYQANRT